MKILAIGDFHGKFPKDLKRKAKEVDLIVSVGDYADTNEFRELEFKYWDKLKDNFSLEKILGKKRYTYLLKKQSLSQERVLKRLSSFAKPIICIYGNSDLPNKEAKRFLVDGIETQCKKLKIKLLKNNFISVGKITIAGFSGYRSALSKGVIKYSGKKKEKVKRDNNDWEKRLMKISKRLKRQKNILFLGHDVPYGYFDLIKNKSSPLNNKHIGDKYFTSFIKKNQPSVFICGHMHEYQGKKRLGGSLIVNPGYGAEGKFAIIDFDEEKGKVRKIEFFGKKNK